MTPLHLEVITPTGVALDVETTEVTLPGSRGELGILPDHTPLLSALRPGIVSYRGAQGLARLAVADGCAEVGAGNHVLVITKAAVAPTRVDVDQVQQELDALRQRLHDWQENVVTPEGKPDPGYEKLRQDLQWAEAQLEAAKSAR